MLSKINEILRSILKKGLTLLGFYIIIFNAPTEITAIGAGTEKYSSGRRGAPAKGVVRVTGARVQISPSPPKTIGHSKNARLFLEGAARFELSQFRLAKLMILRRRAAIEADV